MEKGELAHFEQSHLFHNDFLKPFSSVFSIEVFTEDKNKVTRKLIFISGIVENIVGKGENDVSFCYF